MAIGSNPLFLREISEKKLRKLALQVHDNPALLVNAVEDGAFNIIRKKAQDILKIERGRAKTNSAIQNLQRAINILDNRVV